MGDCAEPVYVDRARIKLPPSFVAARTELGGISSGKLAMARTVRRSTDCSAKSTRSRSSP
eukprot:4384250-Pyramimonas_sp.AAC.1